MMFKSLSYTLNGITAMCGLIISAYYLMPLLRYCFLHFSLFLTFFSVSGIFPVSGSFFKRKMKWQVMKTNLYARHLIFCVDKKLRLLSDATILLQMIMNT